MKKQIITTGKRKTSIARAYIVEGKGIFRVNKQRVENIEPELARLKIQEPIRLAGDVSSTVNIDVTVKGGGWMSQSEAARNAIAKAFVEFTKSKELRKKYLDYDKHLIVADIRRTEPQKPYRSAARAQRQTSKR